MSVAVVTTVPQLHTALNGRQPAFVPTMGALHEGHAALVRRARQIAGKRGILRRPKHPVVVSIFVNPTQFGPGEDLSRYPRQLEQDINVCKNAGADVVFAPGVEEVYPAGQEKVAEGFVIPLPPDVAIKPGLEDAFRPGHFMGVAKVVARLFDIVQPAHAIFGEKDYQQLLVISAMVKQEADRWRGLQIIPHPTMREADGLALSSRNVYLDGEWRKRALGLNEALQLAHKMAKTGAPPLDIENQMTSQLLMRGFAVDYAAVRDATTLMPVQCIDRPCRALIAARAALSGGDGLRLIDNMSLASSD